MNVLTSEEMDQLELVLANAKREGWIESSSAVMAEHSTSGACILVTATHGARVVSKQYERDSSWPFQLLRDLARGAYS